MKQQMETQLAAAVQDLPHEKILQVIDFARAVLQALEQVGPLQFTPGELDTLLAEIRLLSSLEPVAAGGAASPSCSARRG